MSYINQSATLKFDYRWHPVHRVHKAKIPKVLWPWLVTDASLTDKLQKAGALSVDVIEDTWGKATTREKKRLKLRPREAVRVRTVLLKIDDVAVIYARSIIPARSLIGRWRQIKHLKNKPLGGYLFKHRLLSRSPIEIAQLPANLFINQNHGVWARRSVFHQFGPGILVSEAFFEEIKHINQPFGSI